MWLVSTRTSTHRRGLRASLGAVAVTVATIGVLVAGLGGCGNDSTGPENLTPSVAAASPDSGTVGTRVEITGADFVPGLTVRFGALPAPSVEWLSASVVLVHAPDSLQAGLVYDIEVTNPGGRSHRLPAAYHAVAPNLQAVNGVSRPSGTRGSTIIFEGKAFGDLVGKGTVWFTDDGGGPVAAEVVASDNWTDEFIITTVPQSAATGPAWVETLTGESRTVEFKLSEGVAFSPSMIYWTETSPLPNASQGHGAVFLSGDDAGFSHTVLVTGGADGSLAVDDATWSAHVSGGGDIVSWSSEGLLPEGRAFHGMALATPFNALLDTLTAAHAYVLGGIDETGEAVTSVYRAPVAASGALGGWGSETSLPQPLHSMGAVVFRSWLYVVGGATTGHDAVATVYRAHIGKDGALGDWQPQASLPEARAYLGVAQFGGILYAIGGDAGRAAPGAATVSETQSAAVFYNHFDLRTRELADASWTRNPSNLIKPIAKHSALVAGGTVLVSGGVYNGAGNSATEHQYASIQLDGTIGSFNGATGSQTIGGSSGAGGVPFFNHAAFVYVDNAGEAHVVMVGGNDVNAPSTPTANTYYY